MSALRSRLALVASGFLCLITAKAAAQDLFEIQVYPYDTVAPGRTMVEFHTNFFPSGTTEAAPGEFPLNHQAHLTVEITHGFTRYFETALYVVTAMYVPNEGPKFAGWRIRPRFRLPELDNFPFKVSLSFEVGFNQPEFEADTRTLEIRPIFEREEGRLYVSINPDLTKSLRGPGSSDGIGFEPGVKVAWDVTPKIAAGVEYYAETGPIKHFEPWSEQHHLLFPTVDLNVSPDWELNFGVGRGLTNTSEHWIVKTIVGYRFKH